MKNTSDLTQMRLHELLDYNSETGRFTWRIARRGLAKAGTEAGSIDTKGRRQILINKRMYFAHRLAFLYMLGRWPSDQVDHVSRDFTDNSWSNLREATGAQNCINRVSVRRKNKGLPKGVHPLPSGRFAAAIGTHGRVRHLGAFDTIEEASAAFMAAALDRDTEFVPPEIKQQGSHSSSPNP